MADRIGNRLILTVCGLSGAIGMGCSSPTSAQSRSTSPTSCCRASSSVSPPAPGSRNSSARRCATCPTSVRHGRCRTHNGVPNGDRPWHRRRRRHHRTPGRRCRGTCGLRGLLVGGCRCVYRMARSSCSTRTNRSQLPNLDGSFSALEAWHADDRSQPEKGEAGWSTPPRPRSTRHGPCLLTTPVPVFAGYRRRSPDAFGSP